MGIFYNSYPHDIHGFSTQYYNYCQYPFVLSTKLAHQIDKLQTIHRPQHFQERFLCQIFLNTYLKL